MNTVHTQKTDTVGGAFTVVVGRYIYFSFSGTGRGRGLFTLLICAHIIPGINLMFLGKKEKPE